MIKTLAYLLEEYQKCIETFKKRTRFVENTDVILSISERVIDHEPYLIIKYAKNSEKYTYVVMLNDKRYWSKI